MNEQDSSQHMEYTMIAETYAKELEIDRKIKSQVNMCNHSQGRSNKDLLIEKSEKIRKEIK